MLLLKHLSCRHLLSTQDSHVNTIHVLLDRVSPKEETAPGCRLYILNEQILSPVVRAPLGESCPPKGTALAKEPSLPY